MIRYDWLKMGISWEDAKEQIKIKNMTPREAAFFLAKNGFGNSAYPLVKMQMGPEHVNNYPFAAMEWGQNLIEEFQREIRNS